jgi:hypothetical protein
MDRGAREVGMKLANPSPVPRPEPQWPDVSKPDTRGGGGGAQDK